MTMDTASLRHALAVACGAVRTHMREQEQKEGGDNRPDVNAPYWMRWACDAMRDQKIPAWVRDEDLVAALGEDLVGPVLQELLELQEFGHLDGIPFSIGWSPKACVRKDVVSVDNKVGKVKAVSKKRRLLWPAEAGDVPDFELELSLPYFLLATEDQIERGVHELLAACAFQGEDDEPTLRKADVQTYASTLGRYGISTAREAQAVAHAMAHPALSRQLAAFGFGEDGQGILFQAKEPQQNLLELGVRARDAKRVLEAADVTGTIRMGSETRQEAGARALGELGLNVGPGGRVTPQTEA